MQQIETIDAGGSGIYAVVQQPTFGPGQAPRWGLLAHHHTRSWAGRPVHEFPSADAARAAIQAHIDDGHGLAGAIILAPNPDAARQVVQGQLWRRPAAAG